MITVILLEPEEPGNIGAIARAMKNFNLSSLVLIEPKCDYLCDEAFCRAKHAKDLLKKATRTDKTVLKSFDYLVGTTAIRGTSYNLSRHPLTPQQMAERIAKLAATQNIGILFGREGNGLTLAEIRACDFMVTIPTTSDYAALNISHAAGILFYELFLHTSLHSSKASPHPFASKKEKEVLLNYIDECLHQLRFESEDKQASQQRVWKRLINKGLLTKREAFVLMGFFRKYRQQ
ncbi:RNA methyltransferase [Candidatus Woesearchaeota archaeon]|nr:RNA methyltransferase [Candidatus Woesearchaeota archaeon]